MKTKRKIENYLIKHRKNVRLIKALGAILVYGFIKFKLNIDIDALFIAVSIWFISEIRH